MNRDFLNIFRPLNVLFVIIIQVLVYWSLIVPTLQVFGVAPHAPSWVVWLTVLASAFICAGGYVINDYFDIKIDRINRPDKVIVTNTVSKKEAMLFYQILTGIGIVLGLIPSFVLKSITLALIFIIVPGMLWFYSASYKRQLIIGNLIVALSAALVPLVPLITESTALFNVYGDLLYRTPLMHQLYGWVCAFALFAFLFTLIREIIKDLQDQPGDREYECHTIPIVWGELTARIVVTSLVVIANALLAYFVYALIPFPGSLSSRYFIFGIVLPSVCLIGILWSRSCTAYASASKLCKFIMLIGILYIPFYYYLLALTFNIPLFNLFQIIPH